MSKKQKKIYANPDKNSFRKTDRSEFWVKFDESRIKPFTPVDRDDLAMDVVTNTNNSYCDFKLDYSYLQFGYCNRCSFCHTRGDIVHKVREKEAFKIIAEYNHDREKLFKVPITIGRHCDPLLSEKHFSNSYMIARFFLEYGKGVIWITPSARVPQALFDLFARHKDKVQFQIRLFDDNSSYGKMIRELYAPNWVCPTEQVYNIKKLQEIGVKVTIKIDPVILYINHHLIDNIIKTYNELGVYSFILKPLVSNILFKEELAMISRRYSSLLSERHGNFYMYKSDVLFDELMPIVLRHPESCITFCGNPYLNYILRSHNNCCQFDNIDIKYNILNSDPCSANNKEPTYVPVDTWCLPKQKSIKQKRKRKKVDE